MIYEGYDYVINKPDIDDIFIAHYGIKGMKWHKHLKSKLDSIKNKLPKSKRRLEKEAKKRRAKYVAGHLVDDYTSGRYGTKVDDDGKIAYTNKGEEGENAVRWNKWKNETLAEDAALYGRSGSDIINAPGHRKYNNAKLISTSDRETLRTEFLDRRDSDEKRRRKRK